MSDTARRGRPRPPLDPWLRVDRSGGPDACWPWTGGTDRDGYGILSRKGHQHRAHRWILADHLGRDLAHDEVARHGCQNRACCNPRHLTPGTARENSLDAVEAGTLTCGEAHWTRQFPGRTDGSKNPNSHLTEDAVRAIRARWHAGERQTALASEFHVSQPLISQIVRRKAWTHLE